MKLRTRYTVYSILTAAIPLGLVILFLYFYTQRELRVLGSERFSNTKTGLALLEQALKSDVASRTSIAAEDREWLRLLIGSGAEDSKQLDMIELAGRYSAILNLDILELISLDTVLMARSGDYSAFDIPLAGVLFPSDSGSIVYYSVQEEDGIQTVLCTAVYPVIRNNSPVAYISGSVKLDGDILTEWESLLGSEIIILTESDITSDADITEILSSTDSTSFIYGLTPIAGESDFIGFRVALPPDRTTFLIQGAMYMYLLLALAGIALAGLLGYLFSRRLSIPIGELVDAAEKIAEGKFDRRIIWFGKDELGTLVEGFNTMYDRLRVSQERLLNSERIAAWNQMARKVAHEIKNPLTPIKLSVEDLRRSFERNREDFDEILGSSTDTMLSEIERLRRLTDEFSQFARLPSPKLQRKDIRQVVADALRIYSDEIGSQVLRVRFPQEPCNVDIDPDLITQVMINLVKNALEAVGDDGNVVVTGEIGKRIIRIVVEDTGSGVAEENVDKLFTPYFTTKESGTGLGLVVAYRIVFDHGGKIRYERNTPKGSKFIVVLPLAGD